MLSNIVTIGETLFDEHKKNLIIYCRSGQLIMNQFISIFSRFGFFLILLFFCSSHKIIQISCYSFIRNIKSHLGHSIFDYSFNVCWVFFVYDKKRSTHTNKQNFQASFEFCGIAKWCLILCASIGRIIQNQMIDCYLILLFAFFSFYFPSFFVISHKEFELEM